MRLKKSKPLPKATPTPNPTLNPATDHHALQQVGMMM